MLLVACGNFGNLDKDFNFKPNNNYKFERQPLLESYFKQFEDLTGISTQGISTKFEAQQGLTVGSCVTWDTGEREIQIAYYFWDVASDLEKQNLIFHEAGHCALDLGHDETFIQKDELTIPRSIMYPFLFANYSFYQTYINYYHEELKSHVVKN